MFMSHRLRIPTELRDQRAWIFADLVTGTLWYHGEVPAFKATFGEGRARRCAYRFIRDRGEPLYVIQDSREMHTVVDELEGMGADLDPCGEVDGYPYFLVVWPVFPSPQRHPEKW
jgi:hypothetical protein